MFPVRRSVASPPGPAPPAGPGETPPPPAAANSSSNSTNTNTINSTNRDKGASPRAGGTRSLLWAALAGVAAVVCVAALSQTSASRGVRRLRSARGLQEDYSDLGPPPVALSECRRLRRNRNNASGLRFYLYRFDSLDACQPRRLEDLRAQVRFAQSTGFGVQNLGASFFFQQQAEWHPQRTLDPSRADLFVVPSVLDIGSLGNSTHSRRGCGDLTLRNATNLLISELENSTWYRRHEGRDHLILFHHFEPKNFMVRGKATYHKQFRHTIKNMIIGFRYNAGAWSKGEKMRWFPDPFRVFTHPHLSPAGFRSCQVGSKPTPLADPQADPQGRLVCKYQAKWQDTFRSFASARQMTMFFFGTANRTEFEGGSMVDLRALITQGTEGIYPPNFINVTYNESIHMSSQEYEANLQQAKISLHIRGHDAASSRVMDAFNMGSPQIFLSDRWDADIAPFPCKIPWARVVHRIPEREFAASPHSTMEAHLDMLMANEMTELRRLWRAQRWVARDVLWHLPASRVGSNILDDAFRILSRSLLVETSR